MKKLSIIIINFNTKNILDECLQNLSTFENDFKHLEVIVVDNNSSDGSAELVEKHYSWVKLIKNPTNQGIATPTNKALNQSTGDYILHLGTDTFPHASTIKGMINYMENHDNVGLTTAKLVTRKGDLDMDAHRGFPTPWASMTHFLKLNKIFPKSKLFNQYFMGYKDFNVPHEIDLCISHFMLIKKEVYKDVPKWDEDFFVFGEDVDLCYRIKQKGWKIMYLPQFEVLHYKGVSVGRKDSKDIKTASNVSSESKERMKKESTRAMKLFYKKHYADKYPKLLTTLILFTITILEKIRVKRVK